MGGPPWALVYSRIPNPIGAMPVDCPWRSPAGTVLRDREISDRRAGAATSRTPTTTPSHSNTRSPTNIRSPTEPLRDTHPKIRDNSGSYARRRLHVPRHGSHSYTDRTGARGRKMGISGKQVVNTDVRTPERDIAKMAQRSAASVDEPASTTRSQAVVAQHLGSFDAELGRTRPSL